MKNLKLSILAALLVSVFTGITLAQPATTATTFRMYNSATSSVSITASAAAGTGTFTWPQPVLGIFKSTAGGIMSISAVDLSGPDVTNILTINKGGTGNNTVGATNSVAYSNGSILTYTTAPPAVVNSILVSIAGAAPTYSTTLPVTVPFDKITTATNTGQTLTVGAGTTIALGGGAVQANQYLNGGTTAAVDLSSVWNGAIGEVNGTLGIGNGGTNNPVIGGAGSVVYSDGSKHTFTAVGATGQVLQSNGSGAPTWISLPSQAIAKGRVPGTGTFTYTIVPGVAIPSGSTIIATLESTTNMSITVTARTATDFTVQAPINLSASDFINYLIF